MATAHRRTRRQTPWYILYVPATLFGTYPKGTLPWPCRHSHVVRDPGLWFALYPVVVAVGAAAHRLATPGRTRRRGRGRGRGWAASLRRPPTIKAITRSNGTLQNSLGVVDVCAVPVHPLVRFWAVARPGLPDTRWENESGSWDRRQRVAPGQRHIPGSSLARIHRH